EIDCRTNGTGTDVSRTNGRSYRECWTSEKAAYCAIRSAGKMAVRTRVLPLLLQPSLRFPHLLCLHRRSDPARRSVRIQTAASDLWPCLYPEENHIREKV